MVVRLAEVVGALQHRLLAVADLRQAELDAAGLGLGAPVAELAQAGRHVGDHRAPAREVDARALGPQQAGADGGHAADVLGYGEAGGVVGGDAAGGHLLDALVAFLGARQLDHDVLALGGDLQALLHHPGAVAHPARIDLAGDVAVLAARGLEHGQDHLRALAHQLQVQFPVDPLDVERRVFPGDLADALGPGVGGQLDRLQAQRRIGGDPAETHLALVADGLGVEQPRQLLRPARGRRVRVLGQRLVLPVGIDQGRGIPPDLGVGIGGGELFEHVVCHDGVQIRRGDRGANRFMGRRQGGAISISVTVYLIGPAWLSRMGNDN